MPPKPLSVQLYSLRDASQADFPGVLKRVAAIGYKGVEPAGFYGLGARELRKMVTDLGMAISSSHTPWAKPDNLPEVIATAGELGLDMVCTGFGAKEFESEAAIRQTAEQVNGMIATLKTAGLKLFLHNHQWEFRQVGGRLAYDLFAELCPEALFELDTYWAANFGANDPAAQVAKFKRRTPLLHIKDGSLVEGQPMVAVGSGKQDIPKIIAAADPRVLRWLVVELDSCATDMFEAVAASYRYLVGNGLALGNR
ncbi:MAG: sugar phosphate isomerase/epimerase [Lentisphaeria bacterium]|jgi:sugar phosphate isomerase/epimerase